jgi:hypothetical protein
MKVLTSFSFGDQADLLNISIPTFRQYALTHNYHMYIPPPQPDFQRPWSWLKVPLLISLLESYETVLWLDADVVIMDHTKDILDDCSDAPFNVVVHETDDGKVPNLGVFVARRSAVPILKEMWKLDEFNKSDGWWEQAAFISVAGGDPDAVPTETPPSEIWSSLPYEWNPHKHDVRGIPDDPRFFHATMFEDKVGVMKIAVDHQVLAH